MLKFKSLKIYITITIITFMSLRCATQRAPSGGPVDRIPPTIIETFPAKDSLQISSELAEIHIRFSERMEQSTLTRNLFISPPVEYEIDWQSWDEVFLVLKEKLKMDQTYVISLVSGIKDLQKNSLAQSYQFAFSTGSKLDHNNIDGTVFGLKKGGSVNLFAYILSDTAGFSPEKKKPLYVSKSGSNGKYKLSYLKNGLYRVLAVEDVNRNMIVDANQENIGIPFRDVYLDSSNSSFTGLDFRLTRIDTTAPELVMVRPVTDNALQVRFSEPVPFEVAQTLMITDSLSGKSLPILDIGYDKEFRNIFSVYTTKADSGTTYRVSISGLRDSLYNSNDSIPDLFFNPSVKKDTSAFQVLDHAPKDSLTNLDPAQQIKFKFSQAPHKDSLRAAYALLNMAQQQQKGQWLFPTAERAVFIPEQSLNPDSAYISRLDYGRLANVWGKMLADSIGSHYFTIVSSRELGAISGKVVLEKESQSSVSLVIVPLKRSQRVVSKDLKEQRTFKVDNLPEGKYLLNGFLDENEDGYYSAGTLFPFHFSEPFSYSADTIKVRKRWESENVLFHLPVPERNHGSIDSLR